jgi:hypothetical protein
MARSLAHFSLAKFYALEPENLLKHPNHQGGIHGNALVM